MVEWKKIDEHPIKSGYRKIISKTFSLPNGKVAEFEIKDEGRSVCILALTKENNVILTKQFRAGPEKVLLELPGGGVTPDENLEEAIKRELLEETGYIGDIRFVGSLFNCAYSNRISNCFVGTNCHKIQDQQLDPAEFIEVVEMSLEQFRNHIRSGQLSDVASAYLCLDFLSLL